ncbi:hypothetical protein ZIOFF_017385 [Zingiber officinale]|uniref:DUF1682 family protein n=1 Tax=Zingiber officinale TaxID=94328 RepID=A0A8J5LI92_ZINOF|nr:hypothetical protein ZIOFF_017385 [Zingiber officinale]
MAIRWPRALNAVVAPRGDTFLLLVALLSIVSLLTHELSRRSVLAADFEGFDSDEFEEAEDITFHDDLPISGSVTPPSTSLSQSASPETHHGPPPAPNPPPASDLWDEDEFEGIPVSAPPPDLTASPEGELPSPSVPSPSPQPLSIRSYITEIICVSFLICFLVNYFTGKRENEIIALAWATKFATKDSIFEKNFSLLGTGDGKDTPLLLKEGQDVFKFYASGRRYCQSLLATMEMRSRHDLISRTLDLVLSKKDVITFEVVMNEEAMDHVVLAVARRKLAKNMHKEERDLQRFANPGMNPTSGRKWLADELMVVTESKEVAGDLITDAVLDQDQNSIRRFSSKYGLSFYVIIAEDIISNPIPIACFSAKANRMMKDGNRASVYALQVLGEKAFEKFGKWFISLHFSDQRPGTHKRILTFKFALPDANSMSDMTRLVALVPYYIDLIGRYRLSSHARSKTEAVRAKVAQEVHRELLNLRQEAIQRNKTERKEMETKLGGEALRKKEEKERARQLKKAMPKVKMLRSH